MKKVRSICGPKVLIIAAISLSAQMQAGKIFSAINKAATQAIEFQTRQDEIDRDIAKNIGRTFGWQNKVPYNGANSNRRRDAYCSTSNNFKYHYMQSKSNFKKSKW